jgi:tetratricopeptide (TPR) repeat protein
MTRTQRKQYIWLAILGLLPVAVAGCTSGDSAAKPGIERNARDGSALQPVTLPDLSKLSPSVQAQIRGRHSALTAKLAAPNTPPVELGAAFGEMGRLLMAAQSEAAEPYFINAQALDPRDRRWPYYLAHLARRRGDLPKAASLFEQVLELQPDEVAAAFWLGDIYLAQGNPDAAEPRFAALLERQPTSLSARFGLGRTALAKQQYRRAVEYLEDVLARDPQAAGAHYPLALAYSGLGDARNADRHLKQRREHDILPADPLMVEIDELLESAQTFESIGLRALDRQDWNEAAAQFRRGLEVEPENAALRHRLGTALYMRGEHTAARAEFERILRSTPEFARAHYSLGVLEAGEGRHAEAVKYFATAVRHQPDYTEARLRWATSLRAMQRPGESLDQYARVLAVNRANVEARIGQTLALVQLARYTDARDRLAEALNAYPQERAYTHALARLLAAAPDDRVRNGRQALGLVQEVLRNQQPTPDVGETMAMALAELGRYPEAIAIQKDLIAGGERAGARDIVRRLHGNLQRYERGEPCRTPWSDEELR